MKCGKCGADLEQGDQFCLLCGVGRRRRSVRLPAIVAVVTVLGLAAAAGWRFGWLPGRGSGVADLGAPPVQERGVVSPPAAAPAAAPAVGSSDAAPPAAETASGEQSALPVAAKPPAAGGGSGLRSANAARARTLEDRAWQLTESKRWAEAAAAAQEAVKLDPTAAESFNVLGLSLYKQRKMPAAEGAFRKAVALNPKHPVYVSNLADTLHKEGKDAEAEPVWRRAVELKPESAQLRNQIGVALLEQGPDAEAAAEAAFREAIQRSAQDPVFHHNLGTALYRQAKYPEAEAAYRTAIELAPAQAIYVADLAGALFRHGREAEARTFARKAMSMGLREHWVFPKLGLSRTE